MSDKSRRVAPVVEIPASLETPFSKMAETLFGMKTRQVSSESDLTTKISNCIKLNPNRVGLLVVNHSSSTLYLSFNNDATVGSGIKVSASGGAMSMNIREDGHAVTDPMFGLLASGSGNMAVIEIVLEGGVK